MSPDAADRFIKHATTLIIVAGVIGAVLGVALGVGFWLSIVLGSALLYLWCCAIFVWVFWG